MIPRELYMQRIRPFMNTEMIKVITGIRRCGKSVMMELIQQELRQGGISEDQILALNLESRADSRVKDTEALLQAVQTHKAEAGKEKLYLFFDEILELPGWETLVNSLLIDIDADIYLTGSNAHLLSGELATYLAGRYIEIKLYPFSFAEAFALMKQTNSRLPPAEAFQLYLLRGGFPFLYHYPFSQEDANQYLSDIFNSIILKDIIQRYRVRDTAQLRQLILYLLANIGNTFSASSLMKYLKSQHRSLSTETLYNYIGYSRSACLLHLVQRQDLSQGPAQGLTGKALLSTQEKIYLADHGLRQALHGRNQQDINQVLENIVYMELLRRGYEVTVGRYKTKEIDFCARKGDSILYIQTAYLLAGEETIRREFGALEEIRDNHPKLVLSLDEFDFSRRGIIHQNLRTFLLSPDSPPGNAKLPG